MFICVIYVFRNNNVFDYIITFTVLIRDIHTWRSYPKLNYQTIKKSNLVLKDVNNLDLDYLVVKL